MSDESENNAVIVVSGCFTVAAFLVFCVMVLGMVAGLAWTAVTR